MSDTQNFVNPPEEQGDQPTTLEISETPDNRRKPGHAPASTTHNDTGKKAASQHPRQTAHRKQEKGKKLATAESRPASKRQRQSGRDKTGAGKKSPSEPTVEGNSAAAEMTTAEKPVTAPRRTSANRKKKQRKEQVQHKLQESISEPVVAVDSQPAEQVLLPASTETTAGTQPAEPASALAEPEPAITHPEPATTHPEPLTCHPERSEGSRLVESELEASSDSTPAVLTQAPAEAVAAEQFRLPEKTEKPVPTPVAALPWLRERRRAPATVLAWVLLAVLLGSSFLLWRDVNDAHLYLYALDPASGQTVAQQDLGGGYLGDTTITNPVQFASSLVFGVRTVQSAPGSRQQLFSLTGNAASWNVASQYPAPLDHGTLALTTGNRIAVVHADGLQLMTGDGQVLWHIQGDEPTLGTHPFQPAFSGSMLYAVKSALNGMVAAYDLQSGAVLWTQKLDDTLEYAAPFLLYDKMLYIAADHTLYALDRADGTLLWKADRPARTLLMFTGTQPLLLVAGSQGLAALNAYTGAIVWTYDGLPLSSQVTSNEPLVPAQFYQARIAGAGNVMYATGIVWDTQQVREQLWLFAIDAATGKVRWSEPVGSDFTSADAGRIFAPSVDTTHRLVILQQAQNDSNRIISAYNTADGAKRWSVKFGDITASAPNLLQVSNTALILLNTQSSRAAALHNWSPVRALLFVLAGLSVLCLLSILPFKLWIKRLYATRLSLVYPFKLMLRLWHSSRPVFALVLLPIPVLGGVLLYGQLASSQNYLNLIATSSGSIQWQHSASTPVQPGMADPQGSIVIKSAGKSMHQLAALSPGGTSQWTSFASEGVFSLPAVSTQPGTVLVALSGRTSPQYHFAPDDPAYPHLLDSLYTLSLLDRQTGQIIWQTVVISPERQQDSTVLGADSRFFYVASRATNSLAPGIEPVVQLVAVDKTSGTIVWRIFGPRALETVPLDYGSLLMQGRSIIWQVSNTIYKLDTALGQIQWRKYIPENLSQPFPLEEAQMAETGGVLLVARSDAYHALDLATGNERWTIASPGNDPAQIQRGVVAANNVFLLYGGGTLQAVDAVDQRTLWSQKQPVDIQGLKISNDGTTLYAILDNLKGSPTTQVLAAMDVLTGRVHWTFQPFEQERFVNAQSGGFQYHNSTLYATICATANQTSCNEEALYAINAGTGKMLWKFAANSIYNIHLSAGGDTIALQTNTSVWENLTERFM